MLFVLTMFMLSLPLFVLIMFMSMFITQLICLNQEDLTINCKNLYETCLCLVTNVTSANIVVDSSCYFCLLDLFLMTYLIL